MDVFIGRLLDRWPELARFLPAKKERRIHADPDHDVWDFLFLSSK
jgi:hypothetical protein